MAHVAAPAAFALGLAVALAACNRDGAGSGASGAPPASTGGLAAPTSATPPASQFHESTFDLVMLPLGDYKAGEPGAVQIELSPKGDYHCNDKYPYKWRAAASQGVKYANEVVSRDAIDLSPTRATLKVDFTADSPGEKTVRGQLSFSVCSAERCLVEKRDLALRIAATQ